MDVVVLFRWRLFRRQFVNNEALNRKYLVLIKIIGHSISIQV